MKGLWGDFATVAVLTLGLLMMGWGVLTILRML